MFKGRCKKNNKLVAIKVISLESSSPNIIDIWKEVLSMKLCNHRNVLRCYCCFSIEDQLWIISPLMSKGSLLRILQYLRKTDQLENNEGLPVLSMGRAHG